MPTYTAMGAREIDQPKGHNVGLQHTTCVVTAAAMLSASAAVFLSATGATLMMGKVPAGAHIVAMQYSMGLGAGNDVSFKIGYPGSLSAFVGTANSLTGAAGIAWVTQAGIPHIASLSDDAMPRYRPILMTIVVPTSLTALGTIALTTFFTNDIPPQTR